MTKSHNIRILKYAVNSLRSGLPVKIIDGENSVIVISYESAVGVSDLYEIENAHYITMTKEKYNLSFKESVESDMMLDVKSDAYIKASVAGIAGNQLCKIAQLYPSCFILPSNTPVGCEIDIEIIQNYRELETVDYIVHSAVKFAFCENGQVFIFRESLTGMEHVAIVIGNAMNSKHPLIRIHSSCYTGDLLDSLRCDCRDQLHDALRQMSQNEEGGILLYLMQEGRGIGLSSKIKAYRAQNLLGLDTVDANLFTGYADDERDFNIAVEMLKYFEIQSIHLLTNNPSKIEFMKKAGIKVESTVKTVYNPHEHNGDYLNVKSSRMGHVFSEKSINEADKETANEADKG